MSSETKSPNLYSLGRSIRQHAASAPPDKARHRTPVAGGVLAIQTTMKGCDATVGVRDPAGRDFNLLEFSAPKLGIRAAENIAHVPVAWPCSTCCGAYARAGGARISEGR
jgi:hypothetical protein